MRPKPKIKKIKDSEDFLAYYEGEKHRLEAIGKTAMEAMSNWFKKYGEEFGYG